MRKNTPIPFCSFGGYRLCSGAWWKNVYHYIVRGWWYDIYTYWHRARYGWAPRDTWSLDNYLIGVYAGALAHLAKHTHSYPVGYQGANRNLPEVPDAYMDDPYWDARGAAWSADLRRWARAFADLEWWDDIGEVDMYSAGVPTETRVALGTWYNERVERAMREMLPYFRALWD